MSRSPRIRPFAATTLDEAGEIPYHSALASVGYEKRSRQIPEALGITGAAIPFATRRKLEFEPNLKFFKSSGWDLLSVEESDCYTAVSDWLRSLLSGLDEPVRVAIDVSSMSRDRIADVVEGVFDLPLSAELDVDFLYTPAKFQPPPEEGEQPPVFSVAPVSGYFAGWWSALDKPLYVVVGLGYELERAASALDVLEPETTQIYVPIGTDERYFEAVQTANQGLIDVPNLEPNEIHYEVADPFACFRRLEASIARLEDENRIALVPLGPKIFALIMTLTAALHPVTTQVIRVSAGDRQKAVPQESDGSLYGLTLALRPPKEDGA